jgi:undecaprenyl-diphosphatase
MTLDNFLDAVLLGTIEGITEFLPISSTGHLIFFGDLLNFNDASGSVFEVVIQLGAILAVCVAYFQRLWRVAQGGLQGNAAALRFILAVLLAFLPAAILGFFLHNFIKNVLFSPLVVAISLIVGGIVMLLAERWHRAPASIHCIEDFTPALSLKIGLAQCLAMIPGVSRSGATIIGALLMGVERKTAAEFSFFLAIPTMLGASGYDLWKAQHALTSDALLTILIGSITAFIVAWLVIRWFVAFVSTRGFAPFAWYRIVFGGVILGWLYFK